MSAPDDVLAALPRLGDEALAPCHFCGVLAASSAFPIFYRVRVEYCGMDASAIRQRAGLALMLGGGRDGLAVADAMGAHKQPVVVLATGTVNMCMTCAQDRPDVFHLVAGAVEPDHD